MLTSVYLKLEVTLFYSTGYYCQSRGWNRNLLDKAYAFRRLTIMFFLFLLTVLLYRHDKLEILFAVSRW